MKITKALAVIPHHTLKEVFLNTARTRIDIQVDLYDGNLADGRNIAQQLKDEDYDVIISRGGTALMIEEISRIPVIEVEITPYDMIRIMKTLENASGRIAIVGFPNIANCAKTICELLEYHMDTFSISSESDVRPVLESLKSQGYHIIIGDVVTFQTAQQLNMNGVLLSSGRESIAEALEKAVQIGKLRQASEDAALLYQKILENSPSGVYAAKKDGTPIYSNASREDGPAAELIKKLNTLSATGDLAGQSLVVTAGGFHWNVTCESGLIAKSQEIICYYYEKINVTEDASGSPISYVNKIPSGIAGRFYSSAPGSEDISRSIQLYGKSSKPLLLVGEKGVGKDTIAYLIHTSDSQKKRPLVKVDGRALRSKDDIRQLGLLKISPQSTLLIADVDQIPYEFQDSLNHYLSTASASLSLRLITTARTDLRDALDNGSFHPQLYKTISYFILRIPSLRQNIHMLDNALGLMISTLNIELGTQVVGLKADALELLKQYPWEGNLEQLVNVLKHLILFAQGAYITKEDVQKSLSQERASRPLDTPALPLDGTLEEINTRIIRQVLKEEHMNQTQTALRLGISRATLWRKLNSPDRTS